MSRVRLLPPNLINKIAAGEVVVRPASAVKELVENSLDAGASRVEIEIENNGRDIVVTDDGCGMDREDAEAALQRHATSKIATLDDLHAVATAGFRGEAVPAMASVSRMRIQTRPREAGASAAGVLVEVEGGETVRVEACAAVPGTRVEIRDLFFNVPARRKFLKSAASEFNAIAQIVTRLALARPEVGFALSRDGKKRLSCPACGGLEERFVQAMGARFQSQLVPLEARWALPADPDAEQPSERVERTYSIRGVVALPSAAGKDRMKQFFFANGRPIQHRRLAAVLAEAGRGFVMSGRHAAGAIFVEAPPGDLDVNVHPAKEEVRFAREDAVCGLVHRAAKAAWSRADLVPKAKLGPSPEGASASPSEARASERHPDFLEYGPGDRERSEAKRHLEGEKLRDFREMWLQPAETEDAIKPEPPSEGGAPDFEARAAMAAGYSEERENAGGPSLAERPEPFAHKTDFAAGEAPPEAPDVLSPSEERAREAEAPFFRGPEPVVLGQIADSYIVAAVGDGALVIDQHAAHERLLYHKFSKDKGRRGAQRLLAPVVVDLSAPEAAAMEDLAGPLAELGLEVEHFGGSTYQIESVPADAPNLDAGALLMELLRGFQNGEPLRDWRDRRHLVAATLACKAAVKAGQRLAMPEMQALVRDMRAADLPFTCPHGRPTMIRLTRGELDSQFKRR